VEHARRADLEPYATRDGSFNDGEVDLVVVCACAPPYSHEDTVLLEEVEGE
jgi:mannose-6-phosphate isomerase-like protein (cupin superfamily)